LTADSLGEACDVSVVVEVDRHVLRPQPRAARAVEHHPLARPREDDRPARSELLRRAPQHRQRIGEVVEDADGDECVVALARAERAEVGHLEAAALLDACLTHQPPRQRDHRLGDVDAVYPSVALGCDRGRGPPRAAAELEAIGTPLDEARDHGVAAGEVLCAKERVDRLLQR
jgi:hypothetical protein